MPKADNLSPAAVQFLQEKQIAHVATIMPDGSPQVTPVWVDVDPDGSHILINSAEARLKTRNLLRDPRVAVSVVDFANAHRGVVIRGTLVDRRVGDDGGNQHIDTMAKKYRGLDKYPNRSEQRVVMRIRPHHVIERNL